MTTRPPAPDDAAWQQYRRITALWAVVLDRFRDHVNGGDGPHRRPSAALGEDEHGDDQ